MADPLRGVARRGADLVARLRGEIRPPRRLLERTSSPSRWEFAAAGLINMECCRLGGLRGEDRIIDIGSGVGRAAIPLTAYLSSGGSYTGVDMWRDGVDWCAKTITARYPTFTFRHLEVHHAEFNPSGRQPITEVRLPFEDGTFDFALLVAINHLSADEHKALVREAGRVLRTGGTYVGTWFVVDEKTEAVLPSVYAGLACDEVGMRATLAAASLDFREMHRGSWSGAEDTVSLQDVVIAEKRHL